DEVDAFTVLLEEAPDRLGRVRRLQELDVADPRRQDRVLESEFLGLAAAMDRQPEDLREPLDRGVEVPHDDRQLHDVAQHGAPLRRRRRSYSRIRSLDSGTPGGDLTTMPKRWALSVPLDGFTLAEHAELAREAERLGYTDAWSLEVDAVDGFRLTKPPVEPVPIHIAALRPGMLRVAGEVGDGAILNWLAADDVPKSVAVVREAAARAGRDPGAIEITARLLVNVDPPGPAAETAVRRHVTAYLNVPVYRAFHEWLGRAAALGPMWDAWERGDRKGAVAAVPEKVIDDLIIRGSTDEIRAHVRRYLAAGIDTAFLALSTAEPDPVRKREIVPGP